MRKIYQDATIGDREIIGYILNDEQVKVLEALENVTKHNGSTEEVFDVELTTNADIVSVSISK